MRGTWGTRLAGLAELAELAELEEQRVGKSAGWRVSKSKNWRARANGIFYPTPGRGRYASNRSANAEALAVDRKFTASLLSQPFFSSVAPSRLSKKSPNTAPAQLSLKRVQSPRRAQLPAPATMAAATNPARVPATLTAPSVPGSTARNVVIIRGRPPSTCPISDETVSAAASASAAKGIASNRAPAWAGRGSQRLSSNHTITGSLETSAAMPRFAATCEADRPRRSSAVPRAEPELLSPVEFWRKVAAP